MTRPTTSTRIDPRPMLRVTMQGRLRVTLRVVHAFVCLALMASSTGARAATMSAEQIADRIAQGNAALNDWQLDEATAIAAALEQALPDVPPVQALLGAVKYHQGDYEGAVRQLRRAAEAGDAPDLLALAQSTLDETRGFVSTRSEHFVVRSPPGRDELLHPIALWALEKAFAEVTTAFDYQPTHIIPVDILHDARGLAHVSTLTEKEIETSGTIALCKYNRLMITSPKALARGYAWLDTLSHEFVHLVVSEKSHNTVPIWLHEGLAKFNESRWRGAPGLALEPSSENLLAKAVKSGHLITFEQMHPSMAKLPSQEDTALAFAEVFTVIEFLDKTRAPVQGKRATNRLLEALRDGAAMDAALQLAIGTDLSGMQKEWRAYLRARPFHLVPGAEPEKLTFVKDARRGTATVDEREDEAALDEADDEHGKAGRPFVRLGNLLRERRRLRAAAVEYEKAIGVLGARSPALHNRLAGLWIELGDVEKAKKLLASTVAVFPDDPQTHVLLGRIALRSEAWADARREYERATWENPFNPEIHVALYQVSEKTGDTALGARAKSALQLLAGHGAKSASSSPLHIADGAPAGVLSLSSQPWGRVFLDGVDTGLTTPLLDQRLAPGRHRVRVEDPVSGTGEGVDVVVEDGKEVRLALALRALSDADRRALRDAEDALRPPPPRPVRPSAPSTAEGEGEAPPWVDDETSEDRIVLPVPATGDDGTAR